MTEYTLRRTLSQSFDTVFEKIPTALAAEGFGILTEIDVQETLKKKLVADFRRYKILGACNPPLAHQALLAELDLGVMLPCNVILYETDDGHTVVAAIDPERTMATIGNPKLEPLAKEVRRKLQGVLDSL